MLAQLERMFAPGKTSINAALQRRVVHETMLYVGASPKPRSRESWMPESCVGIAALPLPVMVRATGLVV